MNDVLKNYLATVTRTVKTYGWAVQSVPDYEPCSLHYTVGLSTKNLPELVIFGLSMDTARTLLNAIAQQSVLDGRFEHGTELVNVANFPLRIIDAVVVGDLAVAHNWAGREVEVQQVLYPDPQGRFIEEPGHDMGNLYVPLLGYLPGEKA